MDRLCDEIVQLIFYELADPSPLTLVSRRFHQFSQDPYVRAHYFLIHYGPMEAMYYALGRGKVMTERVLDILLSSGAHLSRYLIQIAIHHYFHTQAHFIKTPWVRTVPLRVFAYFLKLSEAKYGNFPHGKGEDDGSVFSLFLKESRFPPQMKSISWETIRDILDNYNFMPFSSRDPIMAQFPLALAIEPRLLPHAVANGFQMDSKYRDFVFRKMFERPAASSETRADDIAHNVRELCRLDPMMFVTRTVAAEVCMEAKSNEAGYNALKQLDKSGHLRFELSTLVESLIKTFLTTRSICNILTGDVLRYLYADFPSPDPVVRLVLLVVIFIAAESLHTAPGAIRTKLEALGLTPVTRKDAYNVLVNPFVERYHALLEFARQEIGEKEDGTKGMDALEIKELVEEVGVKCVEVACKGKLLKKLYDGFSSLHNIIIKLVLTKYQIGFGDLPPSHDEAACLAFEAKLSRDFQRCGVSETQLKTSGESTVEGADQRGEDEKHNGGAREEHLVSDAVGGGAEDQEDNVVSDLGAISQESLSTMIRHDEVTPARSRRRMYYPLSNFSESSNKLHYPSESVPVGRWAKGQFGARSSVTAVFMTHAVINDNSAMLYTFLMSQESLQMTPVPITLKHFQLLAHLGRAPNNYMYLAIEAGAEFFVDEDDYISRLDAARSLVTSKVKTENSQSPVPSTSSSRGKKRPRRSAANTVRSYAVPDSDDDAIVGDISMLLSGEFEKKKKVKDSSLQTWIKHLGELLKVEQRKYNEKKKLIERAAEPGTKVQVAKTEFIKSLTINLRKLRKIELENRMKCQGPEETTEEYSDDDDDEYMARRSRRRGPSI